MPSPRDLGFIRAGRWRFCDPRRPFGHAVWATVWKLDPQGRLPLQDATTNQGD